MKEKGWTGTVNRCTRICSYYGIYSYYGIWKYGAGLERKCNDGRCLSLIPGKIDVNMINKFDRSAEKDPGMTTKWAKVKQERVVSPNWSKENILWRKKWPTVSEVLSMSRGLRNNGWTEMCRSLRSWPAWCHWGQKGGEEMELASTDNHCELCDVKQNKRASACWREMWGEGGHSVRSAMLYAAVIVDSPAQRALDDARGRSMWVGRSKSKKEE